MSLYTCSGIHSPPASFQITHGIVENSAVKTPPRILLIEESEKEVEPLLAELGKNGYEPYFTCVNSSQALQAALANGAWDIILGNYNLPACPGEQALKWLGESGSEIPYIALLDRENRAEALAAMRAGARDSVSKDQLERLLPVVRRELLDVQVRNALNLTEKALEREIAKSRYFLEVAGVMIIAVDSSGHVVLVNEKGSDLLEYPRSEIIGKNWVEHFVPASHREHVSAMFRQLFHGSVPSIECIEYPILTKTCLSKSIVWHKTSLVPMEQDGAAVVFSSGTDAAEEELMKQRKEAFISTLTHDLNTPIQAESQVLELLVGENFGPLTDQQKGVLQEILHSKQFMRRMIDNLLAIYKYEDRQISLKLKLSNLNRIIQGDLIQQIRSLAQEKGQSLILRLDPDLPATMMDPGEIERVLSSLMQNAVFFSPEGTRIVITTRKQGGTICFSIEDKGQGIEPEVMKTLFNRYSNIAKKFRQVGIGLSLYLSKQIIESHHGEIGVKSQMGKGSEFFFTLPVIANGCPKISH